MTVVEYFPPSNIYVDKELIVAKKKRRHSRHRSIPFHNCHSYRSNYFVAGCVLPFRNKGVCIKLTVRMYNIVIYFNGNNFCNRKLRVKNNNFKSYIVRAMSLHFLLFSIDQVYGKSKASKDCHGQISNGYQIEKGQEVAGLVQTMARRILNLVHSKNRLNK